MTVWKGVCCLKYLMLDMVLSVLSLDSYIGPSHQLITSSKIQYYIIIGRYLDCTNVLLRLCPLEISFSTKVCKDVCYESLQFVAMDAAGLGTYALHWGQSSSI